MLDDAKLAVLSDGRGALPSYTFQFPVDDRHYLQGDFFNWPPPEFAKCWPVSN